MCHLHGGLDCGSGVTRGVAYRAGTLGLPLRRRGSHSGCRAGTVSTWVRWGSVPKVAAVQSGRLGGVQVSLLSPVLVSSGTASGAAAALGWLPVALCVLVHKLRLVWWATLFCLPKSCLFRRLQSHVPVCAAIGSLRPPANATPVHPAACRALVQVRGGIGTVFLLSACLSPCRAFHCVRNAAPVRILLRPLGCLPE